MAYKVKYTSLFIFSKTSRAERRTEKSEEEATASNCLIIACSSVALQICTKRIYNLLYLSFLFFLPLFLYSLPSML